MTILPPAVDRSGKAAKESAMELDPPGATTTSTTSNPRSAGAVTAQPVPRLGAVRTACLGLVGTLAIVVGAIMGGQSFETHFARRVVLRDARWPLRFVRDGQRVATGRRPWRAVFGGLILLTRVWLGFLRHLRDNPGFPVNASSWWCSSGPCRSCWRHRCSAATSTRMRRRARWSAVTSTRTPMARASSARPRSTRWQMRCGRTQRRPYGPSFLAAGRGPRPGLWPSILPDLVLLRLLEVAGVALMWQPRPPWPDR